MSLHVHIVPVISEKVKYIYFCASNLVRNPDADNKETWIAIFFGSLGTLWSHVVHIVYII